MAKMFSNVNLGKLRSQNLFLATVEQHGIKIWDFDTIIVKESRIYTNWNYSEIPTFRHFVPKIARLACPTIKI